MDAILVLMQVGQNDDWLDRGLPEVVVAGFGQNATPADGGVEWLMENRPDAVQHWRLLVWELTGEPYDRSKPDAVVTPEDFQAAATSNRKPVTRRRARRLVVSKVLHKVPVGDDLLGRTILITQDRANSSAGHAGGPWYVAAAPGQDAVAARIYQVATVERGDRVEVRLGTKAGEIGGLALGQGVIPVDED